MRLKKFVAAFAVTALACAMLCMAGCGSTGMLVEEGELHVALHPGYAGFEELDEQGNYTGVDVELAQMLADDMGLTLVIDNMDFDSVIPAVKSGTKVDMGISGITITDERSKDITFSTPYYSDDQSITVLDTEKYTKDNYKEALNQEGIVIYCQQGTTGETYAKENFPNATITAIPGITEVFTVLSTGKCDAVVQNAAPTKSLISQSFTDLTVIDSVATGETYGVAMNQDNQELIDQVNSLIEKYQNDGSLEALLVKYGV